MAFYKETIQQYNHLYSIGILPQIDGRYFSGSKINFKTIKSIGQPLNSSHEQKVSSNKFSLQKARQRLSYELKLAQQQNRINQNYKTQQIASMFFKKELQDRLISEKRIHTMSIDNIYQVQKAKSKRMNSKMNHRRILTLSKNKSDVVSNGNHLNGFKIPTIIKDDKIIKRNHVYNRSTDAPQQKIIKIKIKINKEPVQLYNFTTNRSFVLTENIDKQKISLKKPQIHREDRIKISYLTQRKQFFNNCKQKKQNTFKKTNQKDSFKINGLQNNKEERKKKNSLDLIDDLDILSLQKDIQQQKESSNDIIQRWK